MSRIAFIYRTDVHASDKSPASWKGDYPAEIWSNLEQIGQMANEHKVAAVLDGGDYFHIKSASRNSHALMYRTGVIHSEYDCSVYCVEGNHDLAYNNLRSIDRQPLGVLYIFDVFRQLREEVFTDGDLQVRVIGVPYNLKRTLGDLLEIQKQPGDDFLVAVVHALAAESAPPSVEGFFKEPVFNYADLVTPNGPDVWAFGHWHHDQGVVCIDGKYFVNQGAISRGALIHENVKRVPQVALLEFESSEIHIKTLPLQVEPAEEVFDFEKKERIESENRSIDTFIEKLQEDATFDPSATIEANIQSLDFAEEVRELALVYLERARGEG
jgi:DNA repair exonuclease SbcCD nuclease subunit